MNFKSGNFQVKVLSLIAQINLDILETHKNKQFKI